MGVIITFLKGLDADKVLSRGSGTEETFREFGSSKAVPKGDVRTWLDLENHKMKYPGWL